MPDSPCQPHLYVPAGETAVLLWHLPGCINFWQRNGWLGGLLPKKARTSPPQEGGSPLVDVSSLICQHSEYVKYRMQNFSATYWLFDPRPGSVNKACFGNFKSAWTCTCATADGLVCAFITVRDVSDRNGSISTSVGVCYLCALRPSKCEWRA